MSVEKITAKITVQGAKRLARATEVKVILDGSDLRKPHSSSLEFLSTVRALNGDLIPGYPTLNAIGIAPDGTQALLYHTTFSPLKPGFKSEREASGMASCANTKAVRARVAGKIMAQAYLSVTRYFMARGTTPSQTVFSESEKTLCWTVLLEDSE